MDNASPVMPFLMYNPSKIVDGISVYDRKDYNEWFEAEYSNNNEPWKYSHRAVELYRHQYSVTQILRHNAAPQMLLELGCSKGLMTKRLIPFCHTIFAADISLTALKACKQSCDVEAEKSSCHIKYFVTTTPGLPFAADSFDVVTICDGLAGWYLPEEQWRTALHDAYRVLKKGGVVILTDYLMPEQDKNEFETYKALVQDSPFSIVEVSYLYDKPWYMLESLLKKTGLEHILSSLLSSITIAKTLNSLGRIFGRQASRHIVIIVRKD